MPVIEVDDPHPLPTARIDRTWRLIGAALALGALCSAGVVTALRADAQTRAPAAVGAASDDSPIKDDPTAAPDARESADDNLTFPTDI
jgi:hypothetical protein